MGCVAQDAPALQQAMPNSSYSPPKPPKGGKIMAQHLKKSAIILHTFGVQADVQSWILGLVSGLERWWVASHRKPETQTLTPTLSEGGNFKLFGLIY